MDLEPFHRINPCGYQGLQVTQMMDLGGPSSITEVEDVLIANLARQLGMTPEFVAEPMTSEAGQAAAACVSLNTMSTAPDKIIPISIVDAADRGRKTARRGQDRAQSRRFRHRRADSA